MRSKRPRSRIDFSGQEVVAVTTEAIRRAKNAEDVLARIERETGISFKVIDGRKEAALTLEAVRFRLNKLLITSERFVVADIGGGSTELSFVYGHSVITRSFPIGIVTIAQTYSTLKRIEEALPSEMLSMQKFAAEMFATKGEVETFVATAGTPTTVAAMKLGQTYDTYDAKKINGTTLRVEELDIYLKKLLSQPFEVREQMVGVGRSDLIAAGILIFKHLYRILEAEQCIVVDDGLREGVALAYCASKLD